MLIGHGIEQRCDAALFVVEPKICGSNDR